MTKKKMINLLVKQHNKMLEKFNIDIKLKATKVNVKIHSSLGKPKLCYSNAVLHVIEKTTSKYVLGIYLMEGIIPIDHAWVKDGSIYLDVTIREKKENDEYYSMLELDYKTVRNLMLKYRIYPGINEYVRNLIERR